MHVAEFLRTLASRPHIEVVETLLPDVLRHVLEQTGLRRIAAPPFLGQNAPRKTKFESLHHSRRILLLPLADKQMSVFGHNGVSDDDEHIALSHLLQHFEQQVTAERSAEQRLSPIATASDEMKITGAIVAVKVVPYDERITPPEGRGGDGGHRPIVIKKSGSRAVAA